MTDIITIGEILIDLTQTGTNEHGVPVLAANPGGAPANVAVAAAKLGARTAFIGMAGADGFGSYLRRVLRDNNVDDTYLLTADAPTTMAIVSVDEAGERDFRFVRGADAQLCADELDASVLAHAKFLHFGSVSLTAEPARSATLAAAQMARQAGVLVSYDPNYRAALWPDEEGAVREMRAAVQCADVIKLSDEEVKLLTGTDDPEEGCRRLEAQGVRLILLTLGGEGALCRWKGETIRVPGVATKVADTNGAGDTFFGAVLSRLAARGDAPLEGLDLEALRGIVAFANRAAALTCSRSGAIPAMPTLAELEQN